MTPEENKAAAAKIGKLRRELERLEKRLSSKQRRHHRARPRERRDSARRRRAC